MKYCLKCGKIYAESYEDYERENCYREGFPLIEAPDMTEEKFLQLSEKEKDAYELHILDLCRQSEFFDESEYEHKKGTENYYFTYRFDKYEQITGKKAKTKENELYHKMKARESINRDMALYADTVYKKPKPPEPEDKGCLHIILLWLVVIASFVFSFCGAANKESGWGFFVVLLGIGTALGGQMLLAWWFPKFSSMQEKRKEFSERGGFTSTSSSSSQSSSDTSCGVNPVYIVSEYESSANHNDCSGHCHDSGCGNDCDCGDD